MDERQLQIIVDPLFRIATALERLVELKSKPRQTRTSAPAVYDPEFINAWKAYPSRNGSNSKAAAFKAWRTRMKQSNDVESKIALMSAGVERYALWCHATDKTGTDLVMQASRFFGPGHEYENLWDVPRETLLIRVPHDLDRLVKFASDYGLIAHTGEKLSEFRRRVEDHIAQSTL